jgi:hypothetical protein
MATRGDTVVEIMVGTDGVAVAVGVRVGVDVGVDVGVRVEVGVFVPASGASPPVFAACAETEAGTLATCGAAPAGCNAVKSCPTTSRRTKSAVRRDLRRRYLLENSCSLFISTNPMVVSILSRAYPERPSHKEIQGHGSALGPVY